MQHIIIISLGNGYFSLKPEAGFILLNKRTRQLYSDAVVKDKKPWTAVAA